MQCSCDDGSGSEVQHKCATVEYQVCEIFEPFKLYFSRSQGLGKQCLIFSFFVLKDGEIIGEYGDRGEESLEDLFGMCGNNGQRMRCQKCKKDRRDIFDIARRYINYEGVIRNGRCEDWR